MVMSEDGLLLALLFIQDVIREDMKLMGPRRPIVDGARRPRTWHVGCVYPPTLFGCRVNEGV